MPFVYDHEAREDAICQLIDARIKAIKADILIKHASTTDAVLTRLPIADEDEARAVLWKAVTGGSSAVGLKHASVVELAIFEEAQALAEADVADMERHREEAAAQERAGRAVFDALFPHGVLA